MAWTIWQTGKWSDAQIMTFVEHIINEWAMAPPAITIGNYPISWDKKSVYDLLGKRSSGQIITTVDLRESGNRFSLAFRRGIGASNQGIDYETRRPSPYFDEVGLNLVMPNGPQPALGPEEAGKLAIEIAKHLSKVPKPMEQPADRSALDVLHAEFSRMTSLMGEITASTQKARLDIEVEAAKRNSAINEHASRAEEALAERARKFDEEHATRRAELDAEKAAVDARNNMIVRRELRAQITKDIAERLKLDIVPRKAAKLRWLIVGLILGGSAFLGWITYSTLAEFSAVLELVKASKEQVTTAPEIWFLLLRATFAGVGAVGLLLYAVSWLKAVYKDDLQQQRGLERYAIDLNRASWAVETIMEAKTNNNAAVPDLVIAGVTRGLFEGVGSMRSADNSEGALASLLRASTKAKIGPNGAEFEMTGRGANKLADKVEGE